MRLNREKVGFKKWSTEIIRVWNRIIPKNILLKNFSVLTVFNFLTQFLTVFVSIKIARSLSPEGFGKYNLLLLYITIFTVLASFGIRNIVIRSVARDHSITKRIFYSGLKLRVIGLLGCSILLGLFFWFKQEWNVFILILIIVGIVSATFYDLIESVAFGLEKMEFSGIIDFLRTIGWLLTILIIPERYLTLYLVFILYIIFYLIKTIIYFTSISRKNILKGFSQESVGKKEIVLLIKEAFPFYYLGLFTLLSNQIPQLFLEYRAGVAQIGYFNIANKILVPINLVISTSLTAILPYMSRLFIGSRENFIKSLKDIFVALSLFCIVGAFGIMLFRREIIFLLYGSKYMNSSLVLGYQIWYVSIYAIVCLIGTVLVAINKQGVLGKLSILCTLLQVPILWYGSKFGATYLSAAFLVATSINLLIHILVIRKYVKEIRLLFYSKLFFAFIISYFLSVIFPEDFSVFGKILFFSFLILLGGYWVWREFGNRAMEILRWNNNRNI